MTNLPFGDCSSLPVIISGQVHDDPNPAEKMILAVTFLCSCASRTHVTCATACPPLLDGAWSWNLGSLYLAQQVFHLLQVCTARLPTNTASVTNACSCPRNERGAQTKLSIVRKRNTAISVKGTSLSSGTTTVPRQTTSKLSASHMLVNLAAALLHAREVHTMAPPGRSKI